MFPIFLKMPASCSRADESQGTTVTKSLVMTTTTTKRKMVMQTRRRRVEL